MPRQFIVLFSVLLCSYSLSAQTATTITQRLIGKWEGTDNRKETGGMEFIDSVRMQLSPPGTNLPEGTYRIDTTKKPMKLDIIIAKGQYTDTLPCLIEFVDKNTLKWQPFFNKKRPAQFVKETGDNTLRLKE